MFPSFIGILDIQSWWEVPSIAYFCSLFRTAFNLLDFDIEELEEALLTDGTEESASSLLTELIVRLLNGCLGNNDISAFNYQMYLRRLFRRKCQETGRYNPFNTDIDFQFLPLRTKVEILYALCDFRLDADDVFDLFKNLEAESLRVEPLGFDVNDSAYWYFYGTRLYREDIIKKPKSKGKKKKGKESKKRGWFYGDDWLDDENTERVWQVVCFTEEDWGHLTEKFSKATSKVEKELYRSLSQNFLPEIPRLFQEKERLQRKRLLELAPRRTSSRVLQKIKQKEEESKPSDQESKEPDEDRKEQLDLARENRAKRRNLIRTRSDSESSEISSSDKEMPQKATKRPKSQDKRSKNSSATQKGEPPPPPPIKTGRKTNNSLASATGQIVIPDNEEPVNSTRKKLKTSQIFSQTEEDIQTDMYKVLEQLTAHDDAWPFMDPVEEEYAPNYYAVIRRPMDLKKMEERLDSGYYPDFSMFKADFKLIVNNCRLYNGQDNEYTIMVDNLQAAFDRLTEKYIHRLSSSDEEIAVEYQLPTPSRKHKLKNSESPPILKRKKRKSHSESGEGKATTSDPIDKDDQIETPKVKESRHKSKDGKIKKKHKSHHRHGKHSKNHKKGSHHKSGHGSKYSKKQKRVKDKEGKKSKQKKKRNKHSHVTEPPPLPRSNSRESLESSYRSRSASPLPSIHTPSPSPTEASTTEQIVDSDFFKDKYDKIKERRRNATKDAWESLFDYKHNKQKQNLNVPEKDKNAKLRETIEKLKAKNEKYRDNDILKNLFTSDTNKSKNVDSSSTKGEDKDLSDDDPKDQKEKKTKSVGKKPGKKNSSAKNESASEALEQAVKDISKWLDDAPKGSSTSSPCDSPAQTISTEEHDSRQDDEFGLDKTLNKKESRKRPSSREPKTIKRREIQRTIDRLQPGKSKGNLLTNISTNKNVEKIEESTPAGPLIKSREIIKTDESKSSSPKLSLGSVLPTVEFTLGNDHNFDKGNKSKVEGKKEVETLPTEKEVPKDVKEPEPKVTPVIECDKETKIEEAEPQPVMKPSQEKATPNLSAWFKAFGTPKSTSSTTSASTTTGGKKKDEPDQEEKVDNTKDDKPPSPKNPSKYDSPDTPNPEGGDSPLPNPSNTPRQRRTSTGSSISERSSFSQDLDSPRHQLSHTSPLLRSPASPRTEDFQKISYPIINGTVRAGFYQDTTSIKSSPEKSCSPREGPQSPYSPYSQHVYVSNNMGSTTPNYFCDHNKSPLPSYGQNQPPFYETAKATVNKPKVHEDYSTLGPDSFHQTHFGGSYSPSHPPFVQGQQSGYSQPQISPQTALPNSPVVVSAPTPTQDPKNTTHFPVKKRTYNEPDNLNINPKKPLDSKESPSTPQNKNEYQKMVQSMHTISSLPTTSVDEIPAVLTEKSEQVKLNNHNSRPTTDSRKSPAFNYSDVSVQKKKDNNTNAIPNKPIGIPMTKSDNIDMVNMGYMNPETERRSSGDSELDYSAANREAHKANMLPQPKGYEIDAIAMNLGMNSHNIQKTMQRPNIPNHIPPAHSHDRSNDLSLNHHMLHHHPEYETMSSGQSASNFSLNDIEAANKKLYSCNTSTTETALDYGNWKMTNQIKKHDVLPSDYSNYSTSSIEKVKNDAHANSANSVALNYNKNVQHSQQIHSQQQQYHNYNMPRPSMQNLPSELRIPNPRGLVKNDHMTVSSSVSPNDLSKMSETTAKSQKSDKLIQSHPLVSSLQYKTPYSTHSGIPLDSLRNLPNIPQMLERYTNDERYLSSFAATNSSLYHDKTFQMAQMSQMFNKSMSSDTHPVSSSVGIYSQPSVTMSKETSLYKTTSTPHSTVVDTKSKSKRKRTSDVKSTPVMSNQNYASSCSTSDVLSSVKTSMVPGSAFNFGASTNIALGSGLYGDNSGFSIEDFRNSTANQLMAANYMAAAVAHQQRSTAESSGDKLKGSHGTSGHSSSAFPFMGASQVRSSAGYGFVGADSSSPLYQQYLQRQEEILRQTGAQIMGLYPPGYPAALAARQPYDRPSWL